MNNVRQKVLIVFVFSVIFVFIFLLSRTGLKLSPSNTQQPTEKHSSVALYTDKGTWNDSVRAAESMFQWMNHTVKRVDAAYFNNKKLNDFQIICIPGGDMYQYSQDISSTGKAKIVNFVRDGGGYLGICGGAYFASEEVVWQGNQLPMTPLGMFSGTASGPINEIIPYPNYTICQVNIVNSSHPITQSGASSEWMLYYWGPMFIPNEDSNVTILGSYDSVDQPAMLSFQHGLGRVFLIGMHPEIEEDSDRDGVDFAEDFDDKGSDWELVRKAVLWLEKKNQ